MVVESFLTNAVYRSTCSSMFGLIMVTLGVVFYSCADYEFSWLGTLYSLLSTFMMVWEGLLKRHLLTDQKQPLVLSLQAMVFINNAVGCALALLLVLSYEIWIFGYNSLPNIAFDEICYIVGSVFLSACYHYMGLQLAKAVSATSLLAANNFSKICIVVFGAAYLGDTATTLAWAGVVLAVLGNIVYMLARLHVMQQQALRRQTGGFDNNDKMAKDAKDINENIVAKGDEGSSTGEYGAKAAQWMLNPDVSGAMESLRPTWLGGQPSPAELGATVDGDRGMLGGGMEAVGCLPPLSGAPAAEGGTPPSYSGSGVTIDGEDPFAPALEQPRERLSALRQRVMGGDAAAAPAPDDDGYTYSTDDANPGRSTVGSVVNCAR